MNRMCPNCLEPFVEGKGRWYEVIVHDWSASAKQRLCSNYCLLEWFQP